MTESRTTYTVADPSVDGVEWRTNSTERAARLARAGFTVTAVTEGRR